MPLRARNLIRSAAFVRSSLATTLLRGALLVAALLGAALLPGCGAPVAMGARPPAATAEVAGVAHTQGFFPGKGGVSLFEQAWRPAQGQPRATFVIMHGLLDHSSRYEELARTLVANGIAVHAFDLRGHGRSAGVRVAVDSFGDYVDDLAMFTERVRHQENDVPVFVMGHSMGGAIVTLYVLDKKPRLAGVVLSGPALHANVDGAKIAGTKAVAALSPNAGVFKLDIDKFSRDPKVVADCKKDPLVYTEGAPARTAKELLNALDTIDERMDEVFVPLLILHGEDDEITDPNGSRALYDRTRSADRTLRIYPKLVHDLVHEPEKGRVLTDINEWTVTHAKAIEERAAAQKKPSGATAMK
jgi:alpha-beta hydrolase superfamily lysophospholipase